MSLVQPSNPAWSRLSSVASRWLLRRPVMKNTEIFRALMALKKVRVGSMAGATAMWIHSSKPQAMLGCCVHGPLLMKPKLLSSDVLPVGQRGLVDIEHHGGKLDLVGAALDIGARIGDHRGDIVDIIAGLIRQQLLLVLVDIDRRLLPTAECAARAAPDNRRPGHRRAERSSAAASAAAASEASAAGNIRAAARAVFTCGSLISRRRLAALSWSQGKFLRMWSAVRRHSAARVSVGLAVATVGNVPLPTRYRLS